GGVPTGITQNVKSMLLSPEIESIFDNSDFILMLNQSKADGDILAKHLGISDQQLTYATQVEPGKGLLFYGNTIIPFVDNFPHDTELYRLMTTRPEEVAGTA
ncbi:MAG: conjugal transfer protein TraE, partial [Ethanoligenens sp.]